MIAEQFPDLARVWVFTADKAIAENERAAALQPVSRFLEQWATHGKALTATAVWLNAWQLAIVLDETKTGASGCSIDALTRFMRELGEHLSVNWFDRMKILIHNDGTDQLIAFSSLGEFPNALVYDALVQHLGELRKGWPVKLGESRYSHLVIC